MARKKWIGVEEVKRICGVGLQMAYKYIEAIDKHSRTDNRYSIRRVAESQNSQRYWKVETTPESLLLYFDEGDIALKNPARLARRKAILEYQGQL